MSNPNFHLPYLRDSLFEPTYLTMSDEEFDHLLDIIEEMYGEEIMDDVVLYLIKVEMAIA